ncbi:MAG TPA: TerB family tellurite resistance protein [archaeon]|nr:TerB family tellurite resistance protein [archaeon]
MVIFGTRGITYTSGKGRFHCPECKCDQEYKRKRVRRFFTLFSIPIIPLNLLGEYIECMSCKNSFKESVLDLTSTNAGHQFKAEFHFSIKRVMIMMLMADGKIDDSEIKTIKSVYSDVADSQIEESDIREEIKLVQKEYHSVDDYLKNVSPFLNNSGKEMVLKACLNVAMADGKITKEEEKKMGEVAKSLGMTQKQYEDLIISLLSQ